MNTNRIVRRIKRDIGIYGIALPIDDVDKIYLKCVLDSQNLRYLISGSGQPQITRNVILKHKIPLLPISEQKKFRNPFIKLDLKIHLEETKVNKLLDIKKGLMQDMFV